MVAFFKGSADPRDSALGVLSESLGMGIGKGLNTYYANKALDKVLNDPEFKDAEPSKKMGALQQALSMYGENGARLLQGRMQIEQQAYQEKQSKMQASEAKEKEGRLFKHQESLQNLKNQGKTEPRIPAADKPILKEQLDAIHKARNTPGFDEMSETQQYRSLIDNGVSPSNAIHEATLKSKQSEREESAIDRSFTAHKKFIDETTRAYKAFETDTKPKLMQMQNIKNEDLISPTSAVFLETLGIPLGALDNPLSETYNKLSLDLLKGLPETYGSRILKVEVDNFLKTIPSLMNSADGRRMIASNMLKLGEMKEVYYNAMRDEEKMAIDKNKPLSRDFEQKVFDQVKPQIDRINNEFVKLSEVTSVPEGTQPFFDPDGEIVFVPKEHRQWAQQNGGRPIW